MKAYRLKAIPFRKLSCIGVPNVYVSCLKSLRIPMTIGDSTPPQERKTQGEGLTVLLKTIRSSGMSRAKKNMQWMKFRTERR
jgi:hypothetical protein